MKTSKIHAKFIVLRGKRDAWNQMKRKYKYLKLFYHTTIPRLHNKSLLQCKWMKGWMKNNSSTICVLQRRLLLTFFVLLWYKDWRRGFIYEVYEHLNAKFIFAVYIYQYVGFYSHLLKILYKHVKHCWHVYTIFYTYVKHCWF